MDPRLEEACLNGSLAALHELLQEDRLLLHRLTAAPHSVDNPLHIAASLGHTELAKEILDRKPELAHELNGQGLSPLHLAAASGHLAMVRLLLKNAGSDLCFAVDRNGLIAAHIAAIKGRIDVLKELLDVHPEMIRALTCRGETLLHLAVKSNCFETAKFLAERIGGDDVDHGELLNAKDEKGYTVLHLAVARKQLQTVKFLLTSPAIDAHAMNMKGFTPLDVLLESPSEHGDLILGEMLRAAGGKTAGELDHPSSSTAHNNTVQCHTKNSDAPRNQRTQNKHSKGDDHDEYRNTPGTLMVVATLIATITFQAGINPPGGFTQDINSSNDNSNVTRPGTAVLGKSLNYFLVFDVIGLFASLSIILLLLCVVPQRKKIVMEFLVWIMWAAVFSTALAFQCALVPLFQDNYVVGILAFAWFGILRVAIICICVRFIVFLLKRVGWWKNRRDGLERGAFLVLKRIGVVVVVLVVVAAAAYVNYMLQTWTH